MKKTKRGQEKAKGNSLSSRLTCSPQKDFNVEIKWSILQRIAEYYQFPVAVFLGNGILQRMKEKTRQESLVKKAKEFRGKIKELVDEYYGD